MFSAGMFIPSGYESLVEVLDPNTGNLIASARTPLQVKPLDDSYMVSFLYTPKMVLQIYRATLITPFQ